MNESVTNHCGPIQFDKIERMHHSEERPPGLGQVREATGGSLLDRDASFVSPRSLFQSLRDCLMTESRKVALALLDRKRPQT